MLLPALLLAACASDYQMTPEPVDVDPGEVTECGFTRVGETDFYAYDCNPVFTTTGEDWAPTVSSTAFSVTRVLGHPFYQLWYVGVPLDTHGEEVMGDYGLGYAVSAEGTDWEAAPQNPLLEEPADPRAWNYSVMDALQVTWDPSEQRYVMLFQGANTEDPLHSQWGLGVATSPDGLSWDRREQPVLDLTQGIQGVAQWCWPLGLSLGAVAGYTGYIAGSVRPDGPCEAFTLDATDVDHWTPSSTRFLQAGEPGAWDDQGFLSLAVAELDGTWYLFYVGFGDWDVHQAEGYKTSKDEFLGWATSTDGVNWEKDPDPLPLNQTPEGEVTAVAAYTVGPRIHLWVTDVYDGVSAVGYFLYDPSRGDTGVD